MNSRISFFSRYFSHLFIVAVACGAGGFVISTVAAETRFPVVAQIGFSVGLIGSLVLISIGIAALVGVTVQWLRQLVRFQ